MLPAQKAIYDAAVAGLRAEAAATAAGGAATPDGLVAALGAAKAASSFTRLRKIAAHPLLLRTLVDDASLADFTAAATAAGVYGPDATPAQVAAETATLSDLDIHHVAAGAGPRFARWTLTPAAARASAKAAWLARRLPALVAAGSRVLLFSGWTSVLDALELLLADLGLPFSRLDGSTPVADRMALVDAFNDAATGPPVMLLSTRAGGQGLNLVGADVVVLHDADFNPQVDAQAEDRAHRLGQTKPVTVYRLVADGTVDAGIVALAARKAELGEAVLSGEGGGEGGGGREREAVGRLLAEALRGGE
jgi:SWI/SNF-related matrix-associated actin-dependent regulator 1 of chromatin subfamily A